MFCQCLMKKLALLKLALEQKSRRLFFQPKGIKEAGLPDRMKFWKYQKKFWNRFTVIPRLILLIFFANYSKPGKSVGRQCQEKSAEYLNGTFGNLFGRLKKTENPTSFR